MSTIETAQRDADRLMGEHVQQWLDAEAEPGWGGGGPFSDFIETAIEAVTRGLGPGDVAEESHERSHAGHHGDKPDPRWGEHDDARSERAWTYDLPRPLDVILLLQERGVTVRHGLI